MAEHLSFCHGPLSACQVRAFLDTPGTRPYGAAAFDGLPGESGRLPRTWTFMPHAANDRGPGERQMRPEQKAAFEARVAALGDRLDRLKAQRSAQASADAEMRGRGMAYGMRMA